MKYSDTKLVVSTFLVLWWLLAPQLGFPEGGTLGHSFYSFSHANVWHLLANMVCLWMIPCELHLLSVYVVAVLCSYLPCFISEPTVGFSGVLFAIVGMSWGKVGRFRDMLWKNKWWLVVPIFIPHVNALLHVYCLVGGYLVGRLRRSYNIQDGGDWL